MIIKYLALASVFIAGAVLSAPAASPAEATWPSAACAADMAKLCPGLEARGDAARGCRREHRDAFSPGCRADANPSQGHDGQGQSRMRSRDNQVLRR